MSEVIKEYILEKGSETRWRRQGKSDTRDKGRTRSGCCCIWFGVTQNQTIPSSLFHVNINMDFSYTFARACPTCTIFFRKGRLSHWVRFFGYRCILQYAGSVIPLAPIGFLNAIDPYTCTPAVSPNLLLLSLWWELVLAVAIES